MTSNIISNAWPRWESYDTLNVRLSVPMNRILFLFFFLISASNSYSQSNYITYHKDARLIESHILDSSYVKAVKLYVDLFSKYDFVFAEDCFRAAQTAVFINDSVNSFLFLERAVHQGVTKESIVNDSILIDLKKMKYWSLFENNYDSIRDEYIAGIDWRLRQKINEVYDLDQRCRDKHELHPWNFLWRPLIWLKWKKTTKKIVENELIPFIRKHGFPNEKLIGLDEASFHHKQKHDHLKSNYAFMILIHYFSMPRTSDFNGLLLSQMKSGNMHPRQYASLIDFQANYGKGKYYNGLHYNEWHHSKNENELQQINKNRIKIGLELFESHAEKYKRGLKACKEKKKGNHKHIRFWIWCG